MGPSADRDTVMAPPPDEISSSTSQGPSSPELLLEKYRSLKRRFHELEEECNSETRPNERNVRMREEREYLLQKLKELEELGNANLNASPNISSPINTLQTTLSELSRASNLNARSQESNLRQAVENDSNSDPQSHRGEAEGLAHGGRIETRSNGHTRGSVADVQRSPQRLHPQSEQRQTSRPENHETHRSHLANGDIEMADGAGRANGSHHTPHNAGESPGRRDSKPPWLNGTDIAAIAAAAVAAQASAGISTPMSARADHASSSTQLAAPMSDHPKVSPTKQLATLSTLANALGAATESSATKDANPITPTSTQQHQPSKDSSLSTADPAVAAQHAAKLATTNSSIDPNLDPTLTSDTYKSSQTPASKNANGASSSTSKPSDVDTNITSSSNASPASGSTATPISASPAPTPNLSNNPYLSLSTNLLPRAGSSASPPTAHPMFMPYFFYPPTTPSPNSPSYPMPYNPYYYLATPMAPGSNGMYPPPPANLAPPPPPQRPSAEPQKPKPKRLKAHTVTTKNVSIPMVPRDKKGKPMLPLNVGIMTVISLGAVCMRDHFHTERYIFPVGYEVTRRYLSTLDPTHEVVYHCTILDGGDGPKFQIIPSDRPDKPIIAGTATGAWSSIVKQANAIRNRQHSNSVSGPDFFGLGQNTIKHLIQELPNADRLRDYVWQNFVEGGPLGGRHAAVIPALPDEYDTSMPIGAYYPKRDVNPNPSLPRGLSHYPQHIIAQAEAQRAQRLAQEQPAAAATAGPSGSSLTPSANGSAGVAPPLDPQLLVVTGPAAGPSGALNGHEFQTAQAQSAVSPPISQDTDKRTTRSSAAAMVTSSSTVPAEVQQPQQLSIPLNGAAASSATIGSEGPMPTTFAGIMKAYPAPSAPASIPAVPPNPAPPS
ncbi:hypothetical protein CPB84DRAFT_1750088 [Gymnopilus junonius]|uniref:Transforming growth factor beta regulator 1 n=1 Tax=Gymnopilus junonius TaxID=109634 RepID=A0A9P5NGT8_GYMJU|nr:hypothetical protein CPB84DRAFT_1750088 [Gymnopilus junonius]